MYVSRAFQLLVVGALFWAVLYLSGKVSGPDRGRLAVLGQAAHDVVVGVVQTGREVISGPQGATTTKTLTPPAEAVILRPPRANHATAEADGTPFGAYRGPWAIGSGTNSCQNASMAG